MADNTIDTLELEIKSSSTSAVHALDKLANTLYSLNKAFKSVNSGGMRNYSREIGRVSASIKALVGIKASTKKISGVGEEFKKLSKKLSDIDTEKIQSASEGIAKISKSMSLLNNVDFKDSKITNVLGSLKRLAEVDMGKFDSDGIASIASSISNLSDIPDVSSGLNRFMSSLQKLVNAGDKTGQVANHLPSLGKVLKSVTNDMSVAGNVSESVNLFVQSIGRLASAGNKTGQTASQLKDLSRETLEFFNAMKNAPKISEDTIRMTQALAQLASAGGKVGRSTRTISESFSKLSVSGKIATTAIKEIINGLKSAGSRIAGISSQIASSFKRVATSSRGLKLASFNLGTLLKTAVGFKLGQGVLNFGKSAFELGSDITEVQNVVRVAFGNMSGMVDEFAKTSASKFGLSEIAARQYSGTMMAMLKSSGVAKNAAADMSIALSGLAGDIASFYNIKNTDDAFAKIRSGIAGEIEPLRQLGISMTVANLEAFALSQGITKSYQAMTQAEQVMLRYNYLMWASADAQGDFARTSMNWANQVRVLKLNFQQLSSTIGQGLIAAILPAVRALNTLMSALMSAATAFRNFMYVLTGTKLGGGSSKSVDDSSKSMEDYSAGVQSLGDSGKAASGGMKKAASSAKKLKKELSLLPFDQLNQLSSHSDSGGGASGAGSGGGIGGGGLGGGGLDDINYGDTFGGMLEKFDETPINKWAKRIREAFLKHDWDGLGYEIAWGVNTGLKKLYDVISWKNIGPKITPAIKAFTQTFNSMVDNIDWHFMGRTISAGINTLVNTIDLLITGIDWKNLGSKFATGINSIFTNINWINFGNLLGNGFMISWNILNGFVENLNFESIGKSIGKAINGIVDAVDFNVIATTLASGINGIFTMLKNLTATIKWGELATNLSAGINKMISDISWAENGAKLSAFVTDMLGAIKKAAKKIDWEGFGKGVGNFLGNIDWETILKDVGKIIFDSVSGMLKGLFDSESGTVVTFLTTLFVASKLIKIGTSFGNAISEAMTGKSIQGNILEKVGTWLKEKIIPKILPGISALLPKISVWVTGTFVPAISTAFTAIAGVVFSPIGLTIAGAIIGGFIIYKNWGKIKEWAGELGCVISKAWTKIKSKTSETWDSVSTKIGTVTSNVKSWTNERIGNVKSFFGTSWSNIKSKTSETWDSVSTKIGTVTSNIKSWARDRIGDAKNSVTEGFQKMLDKSKNVFGENGIGSKAKSAFKTVAESAKDRIGNAKNSVTGDFQKMLDKAKNVFGENGIGDKAKSAFKTVAESARDKMESARGWVEKKLDKIKSYFTSLKLKMPSIEWPKIKVPKIDVTGKFGLNPPSAPKFNLTWRAKGGLFNGPSVIGVGEAGKEAVLPLENKRTMSMIADSIINNSSGMGMDEETLTSAVARGVAMAMMNNQKEPVNVTCYAELKTENDEVLARAVTRGQQKLDYRMNPTPQFV